jgi:hypothetical protein
LPTFRSKSTFREYQFLFIPWSFSVPIGMKNLTFVVKLFFASGLSSIGSDRSRDISSRTSAFSHGRVPSSPRKEEKSMMMVVRTALASDRNGELNSTGSMRTGFLGRGNLNNSSVTKKR